MHIRPGPIQNCAAGDPHETELLERLAGAIGLGELASGSVARRNRMRAAALRLAPRGAVEIAWPRAGLQAPEPRGRERANLEGELRERRLHSEWYRFLDPRAPNHALKRVEAELYLSWIVPRIESLGGPCRIVDAGGGTGRLALPLARRGHSVTLIDSSEAALVDAAQALDGTELDVSLMLGSSYDASRLDAHGYDAALSIEVLCYLEEPLAALRELARLVRPGGLLLVSVEAWPGGMLSGGSATPEELALAAADRVLFRASDLFVRYFRRTDLEQLLTEAGLEPIDLIPHHFLLEGPFGRALGDVDLTDPAAVATVIALESVLTRDPDVSRASRAWLGIARKPA